MSTPKDRISIISKWNRETNEMDEIGRIEYTIFKPTKVWIGSDSQPKNLADWLVNTKGPLARYAAFPTQYLLPLTVGMARSRNFIGEDGRQYRWRTKHMDTKLVVSFACSSTNLFSSLLEYLVVRC